MVFDDRDYTMDAIIKQLGKIELHSKDGSAVEAGCACIEGKHLFMVEGLSEEGQGFAVSAKERMFYAKLADFARKTRKTIDDATFNFPRNPVHRLYLPHGLTECEKRYPSVKRKLSRCIKKLEPKEHRGEIESAVAVCRASIRCPPS